MSVEAITWALKQPITHSSAKFVLVVLANCASGDSMKAFPSSGYLSDATGQDRKTVLANIKRLIEWGFIEDTGERRGETKQIPVYLLKGSEIGTVKQSHFWNGTENGTVPKTAGNSTVFPRNSPKNGTRNRQNHSEPSSAVDAHASASTADDSATTPCTVAIALRKRGLRVNAMNPNLIAAVEAGVQLAAFAAMADAYPEKSAGYVIAAALSQHLEGDAAPRPTGAPREAHRRAPAESLSERSARINRAHDERERASAQRAAGGLAAPAVGADDPDVRPRLA